MVLQGKVALVTGAGHGIGQAIALRLAEDGADVAVADIDYDTAEQTGIAVRELGRRAAAIQADMGSVADIDRTLHETVRELGRIDILVNNAGVTQHMRFLEIGEEDWDRIHAINAKGAFFCMQKAAREMIRQGQGGRIINIASIAGKGYVGSSNAAYAASKGAVIAMTYMAAHALGGDDINVNAICPGITDTSMRQSIVARRSQELDTPIEELQRRIRESVPIGRTNEPADIAAMAGFLAGPGARNITGQTFNVDGGLVMH